MGYCCHQGMNDLVTGIKQWLIIVIANWDIGELPRDLPVDDLFLLVQQSVQVVQNDHMTSEQPILFTMGVVVICFPHANIVS